MSQQDKPKLFYVTEFKNQFDIWQAIHATRSKEKAHNDAGRSGRVIETIEKSAYDKLEAALKEAVEALELIGASRALNGDDTASASHARKILERIRKVSE